MRTVVLDASGALINIGPWDYRLRDIEEPILMDGPPLDILDENGAKVGEQPTKVPIARFAPDGTQIGYQMRKVGEEVTNPFPAGAVQVEREVHETADGRLVLATDYAALRRPQYPPIGDQLDALWKELAAGVNPVTVDAREMLERIEAVKLAFPKSGT